VDREALAVRVGQNQLKRCLARVIKLLPSTEDTKCAVVPLARHGDGWLVLVAYLWVGEWVFYDLCKADELT
jgi:hypothetical protein